MKNSLIVFTKPKSPIAEMFRTLRTNIQFMDIKKNEKTILITSANANEGKSWISSNLAVSFAQTGKRTLLIDADMRKGSQYSIYGISPKPGLSNYLSETDEDDFSYEATINYIQKTDVTNLYVMAAGDVPPNPSELLISTKMSNLIEASKKIFDIIIIDSPPGQLVTDSLIISSIVDSTLIVTACRETKKEDLKRVIYNIKNVGGKISGIILNKIPVDAKKYKEKYYYYNLNSKRENYAFNQIKNEGDLKKEIDNIRNNNKKNNENKTNESEDINNIDKNKNINNSNSQDAMKKTNEILKQVSDYLDRQKKKS